MREMFVPRAYLDVLIQNASHAGVELQSLLSQVGFVGEPGGEQKNISARRYGELYRLIMRETKNEWFGMFSGGERVPLGSFRMMGLTLLQCEDLKRAIFRASDFADICRGMNSRFFLTTEQGAACLTLSPNRSVNESRFSNMINSANPDAILNSFITWHRFSEWLIDKEIPLTSLKFSFSERALNLPLAELNAQRVEFECAHNSMVYSSEFLGSPIVQNQDSLSEFLRTAPYHLVTQDPTHVSPAEKVHSILNRDVSGTMPSAEVVASKLNVSVTTLRRQLQREETSFQKIKDKCRLDAAYHYLNYAELSNSEVAEKLGFDEPSAFFRSFKKWTGITPGEYRLSLIDS